MKAGWSAEIQANPFLKSLVQLANRVLDRVMGPSGDEVDVNWTFLSRGSADSLLRVTLEDVHGRAQEIFRIDEFSDPQRLQQRCEQLWDELLDEGPKSFIQYGGTNAPTGVRWALDAEDV